MGPRARGQTTHTLSHAKIAFAPLASRVSLPRDPQLGTVRVRFSPSGDLVYLLDQAQGTLRIVRVATGEPRALDGVSDVADVAPLGTDRLLVLANGGGTLIVYRMSTEKPTEIRRFAVSPMGTAVCALGDAIYVLGAGTHDIIHAYSTDGARVRSFGEPLLGGGPILNFAVTRGWLFCDEASQSVVVVPLILNDVRAYSATGVLRWRAQLADYHQTTITVAQNDGYQMERPPGGATEVASVFRLSPTLLGISLQQRISPDSSTAPTTRGLDLATGHERVSVSGLPLLYDWQPQSHTALALTANGLAIGRANVAEY